MAENLGAEEPKPAEVESDCPILQTAVGARLIYFWKAWERNGADPWSVQVLREGYKIPFLSIPPLVTHPVDLLPKYREGLKKQAMRLQMSLLLEKQAIEEVQDVTSPGFYIRLFLVPKSSGEWRPVLDLQTLSEIHGRKQGLPIQSSLFRTRHGSSIIYKDHAECSKHAAFEGNQSLPVPGRLADKSLLSRLLFEGPKNDTGINQGTGPPGDSEKIATDSIPGDSLFGDGDSQSEFSGFSVACENTVGSPKNPSFSDEGTQFRKGMDEPSGDTLIIREVRDSGRLHLRPLQFHLNRHRNKGDSLNRESVSITNSIKSHLQWWNNEHRLKEGLSLHQKSPDLVLCSDASNSGWGATLGKKELSGAWTVEQIALHINQKELLTIYLALKGFEEHIRGKVVQITADSTTALSYITKQGGTHSWTLYEIARPLLIWAERKVTLLTRFIQGVNNVSADRLSRRGQILETHGMDFTPRRLLKSVGFMGLSSR
ncbi:uncharacterized protein [Palaemon carinicauda]|uniref:uncharacterized protein n=1 Tax=Palaemon carinicauda TaxID=392227 RepID=UPI0035B60BC7